MWSSLLLLALVDGFNPVRIGVTLLVISRSRPLQNLLVYWAGTLIMSTLFVLGPLTVLHFTPTFGSFAKDLGSPDTNTGSTAGHIQIGLGVLALSMALLLTVRVWASQRAQLATVCGDNASNMVLQRNTPNAVSRLPGGAQNAPTKSGSAIRRLLGRAQNAWENGSLWVAFVIGLLSTPGVDGALLALTIIVPSGAGVGTQYIAGIAFVVGMLAVIEIALASYLVAPAKTQAVVQRLHDWALVHRRKILVAMFAVVGISLVANGMGTI